MPVVQPTGFVGVGESFVGGAVDVYNYRQVAAPASLPSTQFGPASRVAWDVAGNFVSFDFTLLSSGTNFYFSGDLLLVAHGASHLALGALTAHLSTQYIAPDGLAPMQLIPPLVRPYRDPLVLDLIDLPPYARPYLFWGAATFVPGSAGGAQFGNAVLDIPFSAAPVGINAFISLTQRIYDGNAGGGNVAFNFIDLAPSGGRYDFDTDLRPVTTAGCGDTARFGAAVARSSAQLVVMAGADSAASGHPIATDNVYPIHYLDFITAYTKPNAQNIGFYWGREEVFEPAGIVSADYGRATVWLFAGDVRPSGIRQTLYGKPALSQETVLNIRIDYGIRPGFIDGADYVYNRDS